MKKLVWLSYDLGVQGDYEGLYLWLDTRDAKECGASVASFSYEYNDDLPAALARDLKENVKDTGRSRFYVIYHEQGTMKGRFIIGSRKHAPWVGSAGFAAGFDEAISDSSSDA